MVTCVVGIGQRHCTDRSSRRAPGSTRAARIHRGLRAASIGAGGLPRPGSSKSRAKFKGNLRATSSIEGPAAWGRWKVKVDIFSNPTRALRKSPWARAWDRPGTRRIGPDSEARLSIALGVRSVSLDIGSWIDLGRATSSQPYQALSLVGGPGRLPPLRIRASTTLPPRLAAGLYSRSPAISSEQIAHCRRLDLLSVCATRCRVVRAPSLRA